MIQDIVLHSVVLNVNIHPEFGNIMPEDKCWNKRNKEEGKWEINKMRIEIIRKKMFYALPKTINPQLISLFTQTPAFSQIKNNKTFKMLFHPLFLLVFLVVFIS